MIKQKCKFFNRCHHRTGWCNSDTAMLHCTYAIPFLAEEIKCLEQQVEEIRTTRVKIRYKYHEYTIVEMCQRMTELEEMLEDMIEATDARNRRAENETD